MKKFAIFLPQFHEIQENNEWWGKGFTEWTNVRNAKPLFEGHLQPIEPLNDNYYNLLDKEVVSWQTELLNKYHVDGFAYYHYYFKGRKILEKPAENLLKWKDINQKFFFIWANHSWFRTWEGTKDLLIEQVYGEETDWEEHFQYLLPFFKDDRYEKKNNMPVFGVFNPMVPNKTEMFNYLYKRCIDVGFSGLYIFESYSSRSVGSMNANYNEFLNRMAANSQALAIRIPEFSNIEQFGTIGKFIFALYRKWMASLGRKGKKPLIIDGNIMIERFTKRKLPQSDRDVIGGVFFEWDNTPRHKSRGYLITPIDKEHFWKLMKYFDKSEYVLLNAWNEWAEGMVLEPTKHNGYKYLEWIKEWTEESNG